MNISKSKILFSIITIVALLLAASYVSQNYMIKSNEEFANYLDGYEHGLTANKNLNSVNKSGQFMTHQEVTEMQNRVWESGYYSGFHEANNAHYSHARYPDYDNVSNLDYIINGTNHYTDLNGFHYAYNNGYSMYRPVLDDVEVLKKDGHVLIEYRCTNSNFSNPLQYRIITKYDDKHRIHSFTLNSSESFKDSFTLNPQSTEILLFASRGGHIYKKSLTTEIILNKTKIR